MIKIVEEILDGNILKVKVETPLALMARVPKKKYKTRDVLNIIPEKYEVLELIREDIISNYPIGNHKQVGEWHFKIKAAPKKRAPAKKPDQPKPAQPKTQKDSSETKPSTKTSIRGRMSKIAKNKINNK